MLKAKNLSKVAWVKFKGQVGTIAKCLSWLWLIMGYLLDIWYQLVPGKWIIDSDLAAEMILANMLNQERTIISENWFYSTELRVFNLQWFYRIGLLIFPDNWNYARTFAMAVFLLLVVAVWLFFMKACNAGRYGVWIAAFAIWPFGFWYHFLATYGGYYFVFHIFLLAVFGIIVLLSSRECIKSKKILLILLGCALSLASGLNGPRLAMIFFAPMCLAVVAAILLDIRKESVSKWAQIKTEKVEKLRYLIYTFLFTCFNVLGYGINSVILYKKYTFESQGGILWYVNSDTEIPDVFMDFIQLFGFRGGVKVFSFDGIASALGFAVGLFIIYSVIRLYKNYFSLNQCDQMVYIASISAIVVMAVSFCYMDHTYTDNYWLPVVPFGIMLIYLELKTDVFTLAGMKKALIVTITISVSVSSLSTVKLAIKEPLRGKKGLYEVAMWLEESGYTKGMAEFWNCQCITEMTNGKIEMWSLRTENSTTFEKWLQDKSHVNPPTGKVFFLLGGTYEKTKENSKVVNGGGVLVYGDDRYTVYEFDDVSWMEE